MLKEGQVLWMKFRFNNRPGDISTTVHPYIILRIDSSFGVVELIQCDSIDGKLHKVYLEENEFINADNETVFDRHGFAQLDNCYKVELGDYLNSYKRNEDVVTSAVFLEIRRKYEFFQMSHQIPENKTVYLSKAELQKINR